jgi:hypothetical protein
MALGKSVTFLTRHRDAKFTAISDKTFGARTSLSLEHRCDH